MTAAVAAPPAAAVVVHLPTGRFAGITLRAGIAPASIRGSQATPGRPKAFSSNGNLDYHSGPVIHSSAPYLIFWDPAGAIPAGSRALLERYFTDVAADSGTANNVFGVIRQYADGSGFADYKQTFTASQAINDTQPYPARDAPNCPDVATSFPTCITDAQLQAEIARLVAADGLPTGTGANAPIYFVVTPTNVNVCAPDGTTPEPCADNVFCAYHSSFQDGPSGPNVLYASIPTLPLALPNPKGCQFDGTQPVVQEPNGNIADVAVGYMSHEDNETLTDPLGTGWWDATTGNEVGDICSATGMANPANGTNPNAFLPTIGGAGTAGTLYDQLISGHPYYTQSEWSNGDVSCQMRPSSGSIAAAFSASTSVATPGAPVQFDPTASTSTQGYSSVSWSFGDDSAPVFTTAGAPTAVSHAFATPGIFTVSLTLVDAHGNLATVSHQVTAGTPPSAAFVASPNPAALGAPVGFNASASHDPNNGGSIAVYSWSFGDGSVGSGVSPTHTYARVGTYTVTMAVRDSFGLVSAAVSHPVTVDEVPSARLAATSHHPEAGLPVSFTGSRSSDPDGSVVSYRWQFGDGRTGSGVSPKHAYRKPGTYSVTLTVRDSSGFSAVATATVTVAARIIDTSVRIQQQRLYLLVTTDGPGEVTFGKQSVDLRTAGTARFGLSLSSSQQTTLAQRGKIVLELKLEFAPSVGAVERTKTKITFS